MTTQSGCSCSSVKLKLLVQFMLPAVMDFQMDVQVWMRSLGPEQYARNFRDHEIDSSLLASLTGNDLRDLGVDLVGHRRNLLDAIAELKRDATPSDADRRQLLRFGWVDRTQLATRSGGNGRAP